MDSDLDLDFSHSRLATLAALLAPGAGTLQDSGAQDNRGHGPGMALDIGMDQGRNALFLAESGWEGTRAGSVCWNNVKVLESLRR